MLMGLGLIQVLLNRAHPTVLHAYDLSFPQFPTYTTADSQERRGEETESRSSAGVDDLFIMDQHVADKKYHLEMLQLTTSIKSQELFR